MSSPNTSIADVLKQNASATSNFLSSFNAGNAGGGLASLFASLLQTAQSISVPHAGGSSNGVSASSSGNNNAATQNNQTPSSGGLGDIITALHSFAVKWGGNDAARHSHSDDARSTNSTTANNAQNNNAGNTNAQPVTSGATGNANANTSTSAAANPSSSSSNDGTVSTATNAATDPNAPPTIADLLAQLQAILHMLQKQMQTANANNALTDPTQTTASDNTVPQGTQDLLAAGGALADLLALAQLLEKKSGAASAENGGDVNSTDANANANITDPTATLASLDAQLRTNLKDLIDQLKAATQANNTATAPTTGTAATDPNAALAEAQASLVTTQVAKDATDVAVTSKNAAMPKEIIKEALATADDFLKQIRALSSNSVETPFTAAPVTGIIDQVASLSDKGGAALDADADRGNNSGAAANALPNTNALPTTNENIKTTSPYSFASQLSAERAQNGGTVGLPSAVEQVLFQLNRSAKSGNDQMTIQMHPAELGTINIKLAFGQDGTVTGTVVASNPDTLASLQKDSRSLERALADAGLRADPGSLQFSLGGQNNSGQTAQGQTSGGGSSNGPANSNRAVIPSDVVADSNDSWIITPNRVNFKV